MTHHTGSDEGLSEAERDALDDAALDDIDRKAGYRILGPGGTDGNTPTLYEVVERILAARAAAPDAVRERVEALADRWEGRCDAVAIAYQDPEARRRATWLSSARTTSALPSLRGRRTGRGRELDVQHARRSHDRPRHRGRREGRTDATEAGCGVRVVLRRHRGGRVTTRLEAFRDHCQRMSTAEHKPECPMLTARKPFWPRWHAIYDERGEIHALGWNGPEPHWEPPKCDGCNSEADRALFARLAAEVDEYQQLTLEDA